MQIAAFEMQISVLGILTPTFRNKIGISVSQKWIPLSKMDIICASNLYLYLNLKQIFVIKIKISVIHIQISLF